MWAILLLLSVVGGSSPVAVQFPLHVFRRDDTGYLTAPITVCRARPWRRDRTRCRTMVDHDRHRRRHPAAGVASEAGDWEVVVMNDGAPGPVRGQTAGAAGDATARIDVRAGWQLHQLAAEPFVDGDDK